MNDYLDRRQQAIEAIQTDLSRKILTLSPHLVYHHPVHHQKQDAMFTVYGDESAVCCTEQEAILLHEIIWAINPKLVIEIGSYAGWSTSHMLAALDDDSIFISVDNLSECKDPDLIRNILLDELKKHQNSFLVEQDSTSFLQSLKHQKADLIFIDGFHRDGKPLEDVKAATQALKPNGYILLHDTWMPDVNVACEWLVEQGYQCYTYNTDNQLEIYTKGDYHGSIQCLCSNSYVK